MILMKGDDIIEVKIIGTNCSNGMKLKKMLNRATEKIEEEVIVTEVTNNDKKYGITNFPALIINDKVVSEGRVLTEREIRKLLLSY